MSSLHWTQWLPSPQTGVAGVAAQSGLVRHCTQAPSCTAHFGVGAAHCASVVHAAVRHVWLSGSQRGVAAGQSLFVMQTTQRPSARSQSGAAAPQSALVAQPEHCCVTGSQIGRGAAQSVFVLQPTQAPVAVSQSFGSWLPWPWPGCVGHEALLVHAAWHLWSPGQHAGAAAPQSAFVRQASQAPRMQNGAPAPQSGSTRHWTQPSAASHLRAPHAVAWAAEQAPPTPPLLPAPLTSEPELPPQATATPKTTDNTATLRKASIGKASEENGTAIGPVAGKRATIGITCA
jgi:hypothetical protein